MQGMMVWIRNIAILYLVLSVVLHMLPETEEKKYIQFFGNLLVTICLLRPVLQFGNIAQRLEQNVVSEVLEEAFEEMMRETKQKEFAGTSYIIEQCSQQMQKQVENWMAVYGYEVISCHVEFWEEGEVELKELRIKVRAKEEADAGSKSNQEEFLKNELVNVYNIPEGNINISIQG